MMAFMTTVEKVSIRLVKAGEVPPAVEASLVSGGDEVAVDVELALSPLSALANLAL